MTRPSPIGSSDLPLSPQIITHSAKKLRYYNNETGGDIYKLAHGYRIEYHHRCTNSFCQSCYKPIGMGELYGIDYGELHHTWICQRCLFVPKNYVVWRIEIKMKRKSNRHPNGLKTEFVVCRKSQIADYIKQVVTVYPGTTIRPLRVNGDELMDALRDTAKIVAEYLPEGWGK